MAKTATTAFAILALFAGLASTAGASQQSQPSDLVSSCTHEAQIAHAKAWRLEPSLRPMIEGQRARMAAICKRLSTAQPEERSSLLDDCLREAAAGPRHIQRGRDMDREHIARQQEICRALAQSAK